MKTVHEHVTKDRHLNPSLYTCNVDEEDQVAVFLLFNLAGQIVGYQQYRPWSVKVKRNNPKDSRYYTYVSGDKHSKAVTAFGLETIKPSSKVVFVTEGVFDACRFHNEGQSAIAVLSNDPKHLKNLLFLLKAQYTLVAVCDNDAAGKKLARFCDKSWMCPDGKDPGEMTNDEIQTVIKETTDVF